MLYITDDTARSLITHEVAFDCVAAAFRDLAAGDASTNPVVIGRGGPSGETYSVKSGEAARSGIVGVKIGSYWPRNLSRGLPRHASSVLLLDAETGRARALIEANQLNGFRTAAADAVAVHALARPDAETLAVIGAGHQAYYEVTAVCRIRKIRRILIVSRGEATARELAKQLAAENLRAEVTPLEFACRHADILITVTPSCAPLFESDWIRPGTHISSMGSDQVGKQELPPELLRRARLFCDLPSQSIVIGELQHVADAITSGQQSLTAIGDVLRGVAPGRTQATDITVFDSSGVAVQDLYVANEVARRQQSAGIRAPAAAGP